jgi:hypothetical protein
MALTDIEIRAAKAAEKPRKLFDGGGLFLRVDPKGSKLWRMAYRFDGKERTLSFGGYPGVSLTRAIWRCCRSALRAAFVASKSPGSIVLMSKTFARALLSLCRSLCRSLASSRHAATLAIRARTRTGSIRPAAPRRKAERDRADYPKWRDAGFPTLTEGNVVDHGAIVMAIGRIIASDEGPSVYETADRPDGFPWV